jgi:hypothetical protein
LAIPLETLSAGGSTTASTAAAWTCTTSVSFVGSGAGVASTMDGGASLTAGGGTLVVSTPFESPRFRFFPMMTCYLE